MKRTYQKQCPTKRRRFRKEEGQIARGLDGRITLLFEEFPQSTVRRLRL